MLVLETEKASIVLCSRSFDFFFEFWSGAKERTEKYAPFLYIYVCVCGYYACVCVCGLRGVLSFFVSERRVS